MPLFPHRPIALVALAFALSVFGAPAPAPAASYADRVLERVLPNGLELILLEDHKAPVAVFQIWYRVGSRNELLGTTGLSHMLEHMMFKGTDKVGPEEYSKIIQRNGGQTNAFTSADHTTYFATMASDRLGVVIDLEADRLANLKINDELFGPERDVVKEERRLRTENEPVSALFEQLSAAAFVEHPYHSPVIGWMNDLDRSTLDDLLRHYRTYYIPNNAFIVAVGDFDAQKLAVQIEAAFASIPAGPLPPPVRPVEPPQEGERRVELRRPAELPYVAVGYHAPSSLSPDAPALDVLAEVLAGGKSTRLYQGLVYRRRLAREASADYDYFSKDPSLFVLSAQPLPGKSAAQLESALLAEVENIKRKPPSVREMQKAKNAAEAEFVFAQDSLFYQGMLLGQFEIAGDWRRIDGYLDALRAVTPEDVSRVAAVYLDADNRTVATLIPTAAGNAPVPPSAMPRGMVH